MEQFVGASISGLATGGIYAIAACGLTLTYATTGVFNFAHGAVGMAAAFLYWELRFERGVPAVLGAALVVLVVAPVWGLLVDRLAGRRLAGASETTTAVATIALLVALLSFVLAAWPADVLRPYPPLFRGRSVPLLGTRVSYNDLVVLGVAIVSVALLWVLLQRSRVGVALRATVDDPDLVALNGSDPRRNGAIAWTVGSAMAALAGVLIASKVNLNAVNLTLLIVNAYAAAVVGRLRSLPMTLVGAIALGLLVDHGATYLPDVSVGATYLRPFVGAIPVAALFLVLLVLPSTRLTTGHGWRSREATPAPTWSGSLALVAVVILGTIVASQALSPGDLFSSTRMWGLGVIALSLVPVGGFAGKLSLCQLSFGGIGAVVAGHLGGQGNPVAMLWAAAAAAIAGAIVALPTLRLAGIYLALATAAFAVALDRWLFLLPELTLWPGHRTTPWGSGGTLSFRRPRLGPIDLAGDEAYLVFGAVVFSIVLVGVVAIRRSEAGHRLVAMHESPAACATIGLDVRVITLWVVTLSAAIAGLGGALYAMGLGSAGPQRFDLLTGLSLVLMVVAAGIRSPGSGVVVAIVIGTPILTTGADQLLSGGLLEQIVPLTTAGAAIGIGANPNGFLPDASAALRRAVASRRPTGDDTSAPLEVLGFELPLTPDDLEVIDRQLGLRSVPIPTSHEVRT